MAVREQPVDQVAADESGPAGDEDLEALQCRSLLMDTAEHNPPSAVTVSSDGGWGVAEGAGGCDLGFHPPELTKTEEEEPRDGVPDSSRRIRWGAKAPQERVYKPDPVP